MQVYIQDFVRNIDDSNVTLVGGDDAIKLTNCFSDLWVSFSGTFWVLSEHSNVTLVSDDDTLMLTKWFFDLRVRLSGTFWVQEGGGSLHVSTSDEFRVQKCFLTKFVPIFASFSFLKFYESNLKLRNLFLILRK